MISFSAIKYEAEMHGIPTQIVHRDIPIDIPSELKWRWYATSFPTVDINYYTSRSLPVSKLLIAVLKSGTIFLANRLSLHYGRPS